MAGINSQSAVERAKSLMVESAKGLRRSEETMKSFRVPVNCASSFPSPRPAKLAKGIAAVTGTAQIAARTVPFAAHAHQKHAKVRTPNRMRTSGNEWAFTYLSGEPKTAPPTIIARTGNTTAQASPENIAKTSLISHWRRAETGRVLCHACVPDDLSSPNERIPARPAIATHTDSSGPSNAHSSPVRSSHLEGAGKSRNVARNATYSRTSSSVSQSGRSKRNSLRIRLSDAPEGRLRNHPAKTSGMTEGPAISRSSPLLPPVA